MEPSGRLFSSLTKLGALYSLFFLTTACSTMTVPVLRHETAESLGTKHVRVRGRLETSRVFSLVPMNSSASGVEQSGSVFQGALFGVEGAVGISTRMDLQLGTFFTASGGGWRFGGKYQLTGPPGARAAGSFATAVGLAYGRYSGSGTLQYSTPTGFAEVKQTLSATSFELTLPVSYRFSSEVAVYSGLTFYRYWVNGAADGAGVSTTPFDMGVNLGCRMNFGALEIDLEMAFVKLPDTFMEESRMLPYFGISGGVTF